MQFLIGTYTVYTYTYTFILPLHFTDTENKIKQIYLVKSPCMINVLMPIFDNCVLDFVVSILHNSNSDNYCVKKVFKLMLKKNMFKDK